MKTVNAPNPASHLIGRDSPGVIPVWRLCPGHITKEQDHQLLNIGEVFDYEVAHKPHSFSGFVCDRCGEMRVEGYGRPLGDQKICIPCYEKALAQDA